MPGEAVYQRWGSSPVNTHRVMALSDILCRLLPQGVQYALADACEDWYTRNHPELLPALEGNIRGAFPDWSREEVAEVARRIPVNYLRGVVDYLRAGRTPPKFLVGDTAGTRLLRNRGGKVVVTAHMGNWEVGGFYLGQVVGPHWILAFPERDPGVDRLREAKREEFGLTSLHGGRGLGGLMELRHVLARGETVIVLVDRPIGKDRQEVTYRGRKTPFLRSPGLLAELARVPVVPVAVMAEGPGTYRALAGEPTLSAGDPGIPLQAAADFFSATLERYPDQWYNFFPYWEEP